VGGNGVPDSNESNKRDVCVISFTLTGNLPRINTNLEETMRSVSELMRKSVERNFDLGGRPEWTPLKYGRETPLIGTGRLRRSIQNTSDGNSASVEAGEGLGSYPFVQQFGSQHTVPVTDRSVGYFWYMFHKTQDEMWKRMAIVGARDRYFVVNVPARPYMMFQEEDIQQIMEMIGSGIVTFSGTQAQEKLDQLVV